MQSCNENLLLSKLTCCKVSLLPKHSLIACILLVILSCPKQFQEISSVLSIELFLSDSKKIIASAPLMKFHCKSNTSKWSL